MLVNSCTKISFTVKEVQFGSDEQRECVMLREKVLRKPLGLKFTNEEIQSEDQMIHIAAELRSTQQIVGCLVLIKQETKLKMKQVAVDESYRRRNIGTAMTQFSENYAREAGFSIIYCHARMVSKSFYEKQGWEPNGEEFKEVGIPHIVMLKHIQ